MLGKFTLTAATGLLIAATAVAGPKASEWGAAQKIDTIDGNSPELNSTSVDGCPILSPDGRSLFMASDRTGGPGGLDIWVATRRTTGEPFGAPKPLPEPVNSTAADFCPTPLPGGRLLFVSRRSNGCGLGDIYITRLNPSHGWSEPRHLACDPHGPNSHLDEQGPSFVAPGHGGAQLFFSRSVPPGLGVDTVPGDLFVSDRTPGGGFGPATAIDELNKPGNDIQPNVRKDGREIVFSSSHAYPGAQGSMDLYAATRASVKDPWSVPYNLGSLQNGINTAAAETRPSLSWDARTLLFGRAPGEEAEPGKPAASDIYISTR